ncbi:MAG: asparagine synthase-related protein [Candidatus Odinarchaeota archaeon]
MMIIICEKIYPFIAVTTVNNKVKIIGDHLGHYPLTYYSTPDFKIYSNVKKNIWRIGASPLTELDYYPKPVIPSSTIEKIADAQSIIIRLEKLLTESILKRIPGNNRIGIMFSGGLDSLLLSKLIMKINESFNNEIILITAGLKDSKDIRNVRAARKLINLPVKEVLFNVEDCARILPEILLTIERYDTLNVSLAIPEYFAFNEAKENGLKIIFTGQGADEIFYGYHKYTEAFRKGLLVRELSDQDIFSLSNRNLEREMKLAFKFNLEIKYPYLDPAVVSYVRSIPDAYKLKLVGNSLISKYVLRILGEKLGIPENIFAGKVAMQYGSGAMKALKKISSNTLKDSMIQYKITEFLKRLYLRVISERGVIGKNTPVL